MLGVPRDAPAKQIAETYRALAQIYHPDRYATAPPRVRDEASRRMQDLNAAYEALRPSPRPPAASHRARTDRQPPPPAPDTQTVLFVDGARRYHSPHVLPLGFGVDGQETKRIAAAPQCGALNSELLQWFRMQRHSATMADKLMFEAWDTEQQAIYTATLGCARVALAKVASFAAPCGECQPAPPAE